MRSMIKAPTIGALPEMSAIAIGLAALQPAQPSAFEGEGGLSDDDLKTIGTQVGDLITTKMKPVSDEIGKIQEKLNGLEDRGDIDAMDQKVKDLEEKLIERETALADVMKEHKNELRLLKADFAMSSQTRADGTLDPLQFDYQNAFVKDIGALKELVYNFARGDRMEKAIDTTAIAAAGALNPEVADRFIDNIIEEQATLSRITTRRMLSPSARLDEIRVSNRQLRLATENVAPTPSDAISFAARTLNTVEVIWGEDITLNFLEDNIERANAEAHIASLLARQFGSDLNDLSNNGDDSDADPFLGIADGLTELMKTITTGAGNFDPREVTTPTAGSTPSATFRAMHKAIQERYKARTDWGFFVPTGTAEIYADEVQARETSLGDAVLLDGFPALRYFGRPIWPEPFLNDAAAAGNARPWLTSTQNMVFGIHRNIRVDSEFQPRRRAIEYTISARIGYQLAVPYLFVRLSDVLPADQR